ncbi:hypothetical protein M758_UG091200 [Ceratodon purpureus]|nr:hypothetical protein M758_UG091200 [Ceratodon purpureus]
MCNRNIGCGPFSQFSFDEADAHLVSQITAMDEMQHLRSETPGRALLVTLWAILVLFLNVFCWVVRCFERYVFRRPE